MFAELFSHLHLLSWWFTGYNFCKLDLIGIKYFSCLKGLRLIKHSVFLNTVLCRSLSKLFRFSELLIYLTNQMLICLYCFSKISFTRIVSTYTLSYTFKANSDPVASCLQNLSHINKSSINYTFTT